MELIQVQTSVDTFEKICELITQNPLNDIIEAVGHGLGNPAYISPLPVPGRQKDKTDLHYCFVLNDLKENLTQYQWLHNRLKDERSREVLLNLLRYRLLFNRQFLINATDRDRDQYFDPEIVHCGPNEVFVDCGAFIGDTVESFIRNYKTYQHIYSYEPSIENAAKCMQAVSGYENVTVKPFGVGKKKETSLFAQLGAASSFIIDGSNRQGLSEVRITSLDEDIAEPVSFIKMDVEGCEIDALIGAKRHIQNESPKLAICVYHLPSDIWEIPRLIDAINPHYEFYLRHYNDIQSWETVLYAIPKTAEKRADQWQDKAQPGVYSINGYFGYWWNAHVTKDCGMLPYMFYKRHGCRAVMVGKKFGEYPSLDTYVKGLSMDFTPDETIEARCRYIAEHYIDMDMLFMYGAHPQYYAILEAYRSLRPDGKVYLALDANSQWMDKIRWADPEFLRFLSRCDVIGMSCRRMQRLLGIKWPCKIDYIPNGYYSYLDNGSDSDLPVRENVILTVGRIGTLQKNTEVLLNAYAQASGRLPGWSLRLVGSIESAFQSFISQYFEKYPHLKDNVTFTGYIEDKRRLLAEYRRAKIFVLSSVCEGGNPNAAAEALFNGCYIITSDVDGSADMTDNGRCGSVFPIGDAGRLAQTFIKVCNNPERIERGARHGLEYAHRVFDFAKIADRLHYLFFAKE